MGKYAETLFNGHRQGVRMTNALTIAQQTPPAGAICRQLSTAAP
jgi:hypothetical protein